MIDLTIILEVVDKLSTVLALVLALVGGMKGWYVWKGSHDALVKELSDRITAITTDRNYWRDQAIQALGITNRAVTVAKKTTEQIE